MKGHDVAKSTGAQKEEVKKRLKLQRDKDKVMVQGIFRFHETPGGTLTFPYRAYKEDSVENYTLVDGQVHTIPYGVARHLNRDCWYPQHAHQLDATGKPIMVIGKKVQRCSFQSLEFMENDDMNTGSSDIVTVEKIL